MLIEEGAVVVDEVGLFVGLGRVAVEVKEVLVEVGSILLVTLGKLLMLFKMLLLIGGGSEVFETMLLVAEKGMAVVVLAVEGVIKSSKFPVNPSVVEGTVVEVTSNRLSRPNDILSV